MSVWQDFGLAQKIEEILRKDAERYKPHHLGHPYMSAYQIALALKKAHPKVFAVEAGNCLNISWLERYPMLKGGSNATDVE
mgnify:CR=1 FL=1